jgi:hypothetical protein
VCNLESCLQVSTEVVHELEWQVARVSLADEESLCKPHTDGSRL